MQALVSTQPGEFALSCISFTPVHNWMCQREPDGLEEREVRGEWNSVCRHGQASEVNSEVLVCFHLRKQWRTVEVEKVRLEVGWGR